MPVSAKIKEHMEVLGSDGQHVGTVDHMEGSDRIKLTQSDSPDGQHHFLSTSLVDHVDEHVHLNVTAAEASDSWEEEEMELDDADDETSDTREKQTIS